MPESSNSSSLTSLSFSSSSEPKCTPLKEKVYCEECRWYVKKEEFLSATVKHQCHHPNSKVEIWTYATPIKRPILWYTNTYRDCLIKNAYNNCSDFEMKMCNLIRNNYYD